MAISHLKVVYNGKTIPVEELPQERDYLIYPSGCKTPLAPQVRGDNVFFTVLEQLIRPENPWNADVIAERGVRVEEALPFAGIYKNG